MYLLVPIRLKVDWKLRYPSLNSKQAFYFVFQFKLRKLLCTVFKKSPVVTTLLSSCHTQSSNINLSYPSHNSAFSEFSILSETLSYQSWTWRQPFSRTDNSVKTEMFNTDTPGGGEKESFFWRHQNCPMATKVKKTAKFWELSHFFHTVDLRFR